MGANCCKRGEPFIPGEVLDRVIAEKSADDKCQLYDLANFRKSGILIEAFNNGGSKGVSRIVDWLCKHYSHIIIEEANRHTFICLYLQLEAIMKTQLSPMMYNHGKGEYITRTEYLRWKFRTNTKVIIASTTFLTS